MNWAKNPLLPSLFRRPCVADNDLFIVIQACVENISEKKAFICTSFVFIVQTLTKTLDVKNLRFSVTCISRCGISLNWLQPPFCGLCNLAVFAHGILLLTEFPEPWPSSQNCIFPPLGALSPHHSSGQISPDTCHDCCFHSGRGPDLASHASGAGSVGRGQPPPFLSACWAASSLASPSAFELQTSFCGLASRLSLGFRSGKCRPTPCGYLLQFWLQHKEPGKPDSGPEPPPWTWLGLDLGRTPPTPVRISTQLSSLCPCGLNSPLLFFLNSHQLPD